MKRKFFIPSVIIVTALSFAVLPFVLGANNNTSQSVTTQNYTPARFAIAAAEIHVAMLQGGGQERLRKILFKLDSVTGEVSILQMSIRGINDPTVLSAVWQPSANSGQFYLFGAPGNNSNNQQNMFPGLPE